MSIQLDTDEDIEKEKAKYLASPQLWYSKYIYTIAENDKYTIREHPYKFFVILKKVSTDTFDWQVANSKKYESLEDAKKEFNNDTDYAVIKLELSYMMCVKEALKS